MAIQMELHKIIISEMQDKQLIWLKEVDGERKFTIVIGSPEAMAIDREFGPAMLKAIRSLEPRGRGWLWEDPAWQLTHRRPEDLGAFLAPTDTRLWTASSGQLFATLLMLGAK